MKRSPMSVMLSVFMSLLLACQAPLSLALATEQVSGLVGNDEVLSAPVEGESALEESELEELQTQTIEVSEEQVAADDGTAVEGSQVVDEDVSFQENDDEIDDTLAEQDIQVIAQEDASLTVLDNAKEADGILVQQDESTASEESVVETEAEQSAPYVSVRTRMQRLGWAKSWAKNGAISGAAGKGLCMKAIKLRLSKLGSLKGSITYRSYVQDRGWLKWVKAGKVSGGAKKGHGIEALQIKLTGAVAKKYNVYYRVYVKSLGWMAWAKDGETVGTVDKGLPIEAIQVELVAKGEPAPAVENQTTKVPFVGAEDARVSAYVEGRGWTSEVSKGKIVGQPGKGLRVEAIKVSLVGTRVPGKLEISAHLQDKGWTRWLKNGATVGKAKSGKSIEGIKVRLTGEAAKTYDVYYKVYAKGIGWLAWAKNGGLAGSTGLCLQVEALRIKLLRKGSEAPTNDASNWPKPMFKKLKVGYTSKVSGTWQSRVWNGKTSGTTGKALPVQGVRMKLGGTDAAYAGSVLYRAHIRNDQWTEWEADDSTLVAPSASRYIDAIQLQMTGTASEVYDIWYRVHVQDIGWMGWTRNGRSAGSIGANKHIEAVQIRLVPKYKNKAPGTTKNAFQDWTARKALDTAKGSRSVTTFGGYSMGSKVKQGIVNAINGIRNRGYDVGFIMMDLSTHKGVAYNCDAMFYGASSIKGPYLASVVNKHPGAVKSYAHDITEALFYSWDYNYKQVLAAYGKGPMRTWCKESGVRTAIAESLPWANYSARELAKMWARTYVLYQQSSAGEQLGKWSERPNISTIHSTLGGKYRTRSKAGWINAGGVSSPSVNGGGPLWRVSDDGGIVYAINGAYVIAIMSSVPANHDVLNPLTAAIDAAHRAM